MKFIKKILNLILYHILYKILDPIYIFLDKKHVRRSKNIEFIPSAMNRKGGTYSYGEWAYIIGIFQTIIGDNIIKKTDNKVLDVGCGVGLLLNSIKPYLGSKGAYIGIDVMKNEITFSKKHYPKDFYFKHIDSKNPFYSSDQKDKVKWEFENSSFDIITALSVWTHLNEEDAFFYMSEVSRVLKKNGKAFITFFSLDKEYTNFQNENLDEKSKFHLQTKKQYIYDKKAYDSNDWFYPSWAKIPERAIGITNLGLSRLFEKNNLKIVKHLKGTWKETPGIFFQDIYILKKKI